MEFLILGIVVAFNILIIKIKFDRKRYEDGIFDSIILAVITSLSSASFPALMVGTIASFFISVFFLASPPTFFSGKNGFFQEFKRRARRKHR